MNSEQYGLEDDFLSYVQERGSVRLLNCLRQSLLRGIFPFRGLADYFSRPTLLRVTALRAIQNLGNKTANEFELLACQFHEERNIRDERGAGERRSVRTELENTTNGDKALSPDSADTSPTGMAEPSQSLFRTLSAREQVILSERYGIAHGDPKTLNEIGDQLKLTRERVRQIETKSFRKLQSARVLAAWKRFLDSREEQLLDRLFGDGPCLNAAPKVTGLLGLAIDLIDENVESYLARVTTSWRGLFVRTRATQKELEAAFHELSNRLGQRKRFPISVDELCAGTGLDSVHFSAAIAAADGYSIYRGYISKGRSSARRRRLVNVLHLFEDGQVPNPCDLWTLRAEYWRHHADDHCSGRDLLLVLADQSHTFINLHELGLLKLSSQTLHEATLDAARHADEHDDLYKEPVKNSDGLANSVFRMFDDEGPMQLSVAADTFAARYPHYSIASMYPMIVYYDVFARLAPGVIGLRRQLNSETRIDNARSIMLTATHVDLYLLAQNAAPPKISYPLWDSEMEHRWCKWLFETKDEVRLGQLLKIADIDRWKLGAPDYEWWRRQRDRFCRDIDAPPIRKISERRIADDMLVTALAAASIDGQCNWMQLNQALGWRIETTRVAVVLALLCHVGALVPRERWSQTHDLTPTGAKLLLESIDNARTSGEPPSFPWGAVQPVGGAVGWAHQYSFSGLKAQVDRAAMTPMDVTLQPANEEPAGHEADLSWIYRSVRKEEMTEWLADVLDDN